MYAHNQYGLTMGGGGGGADVDESFIISEKCVLGGMH